MKNCFLACGLAVLCIRPLAAEVQINEVMASNKAAVPDVIDFEDYPDWIELKNPSAAAVNLTGYFLSDDPSDPFKWSFPGTASIPANGYLMVMADGHDAVIGETRPRGYWPWKDFVTERYHTNFSLSSAGDEVVLTHALGVGGAVFITASYPAPVAPATAAVWKYRDNGVDEGTAWKERVYNDAAWASGPARLGYGDAPATTVSYGPSASNKYITTHFRKTFQVVDPAAVSGLTVNLLVDDGAVVYLNGAEVVRRNMPTGTITYNTLANVTVGGSDEKTTFYPYSISASGLVAGDNVIAVEVHQAAADSSDLNFDLGLAGSTSTVLVTPAYPVPTAPATPGVWKYKDSGQDLSTQWQARNYDDSTWASGPGKLGYGDAPATTVSYGPSSSNKYITTYFRKTIQVANPSSINGLTLKLLVDDGAVIYFNGTEVVRRNMPTGDIDYLTPARTSVGGSDETTTYYSYHVPPSLLLVGANVIAVEVHQSDAASSDLNFDLGLTADSHTSSSQVDSVVFGLQLADISYGRNAVTPTLWQNFAEATPGAANTLGTVNDLRVTSGTPTVSLNSGFYSGSRSVTLTAAAGQIRYTLDGSIPLSASPLYSAALTVSTTKVLRARVFETGKAPGKVETRTYFFGETQGAIPYISIAAGPETLFGNQIGIYKNTHETTSGSYGLSDVYKGKEAPANLEFFEPGGTLAFHVPGGIKIGGENNWVHPQKALNFSMDDKAGGDTINYDLFPGTRIPSHASFTMREGGDNWNKDMLRDTMTAPVVSGQMRLDASEYRQSIVFINGAYFGIHDMRVRWDNTWFQQKHRVNFGDVDHLLYGHVFSAATTLGVEKGDARDWLDLLNFLDTSDLTVPANWAFVESRMDIDSYLDFVIYESYTINTSWHHNREFWRERKPGAKYRWFMTDVDRGFDTGSLGTSVLNSILTSSDEIMERLITNQGFHDRLAQRFAAHNASTFKPSRIQGIVSQMDTEIASEIPRHVTRWAPDGTTVATRSAQIQEIKDFATQREARVYTELATQLGVAAPVNLTLGINNSSRGRVLVAGVPVSAGVIKMFPNVPFDLTPEATPGFAFTGWTGAAGTGAITVTMTGAQSITANFSASTETVLGGTLAANTTLTAAASPYTLSSDLIVPAGRTLTVAAGTTILMPEQRNIRVQGVLNVTGTAAQPVSISSRTAASWGGISFETPSGPSSLSHLTIRGATRGATPLTYPAAIGGLNATLVMEFLDIDQCENPIFVRGGATTLRDSRLHNPYPGDCINVKQGTGQVLRSIFIGSTAPDSDGIDFDGVTGGLIQDNCFYRFLGDNCDAMDIGEGASNLVIEGNKVFFCADKGVSVGQGSTAIIRRNLIVGCYFGVGAKDAGSTATLDQNTFAGCQVGLAAYEKNFGRGGGTIVGENLILANNAIAPFTVDALSTVTINYSLTDSAPPPGTGNLTGDPMFVSAAGLNYQLLPGSPAIDSGNPAHALDSDGTAADMGARYTYSPAHYPFTLGETVVINEVLANSGGASDWIELHNRTAVPINIGGWFLSDSGADLLKYRIAAGTVIPAGGYLTFSESSHFGTASIDPGRVTPFALSDVGETVYLSSAVGNELTDYQSKEDFGPSLEGETLGYYYKPSTDSWNFVALKAGTPGQENRGPRVGPIVISEIMYNPAGAGDAEYIELLNISAAAVTLYDPVKGAAWRISDGIDHEFPSAVPLVMASAERIVLVKNLALFNAAYTTPPGTRVFEWTSGKLANSGETLQIDRPGGVDGLNVRQYVREDRVAFADSLPWPSAADGHGPSLTKIAEKEYGNDAANWTALAASAGAIAAGTHFTTWAAAAGLTGAQALATADPDFDGLDNLLEYSLGTSPTASSPAPAWSLTPTAGQISLLFEVDPSRPDVDYTVETSTALAAGSWQTLDSSPLYIDNAGKQVRSVTRAASEPRCFYRMRVTRKP